MKNSHTANANGTATKTATPSSTETFPNLTGEATLEPHSISPFQSQESAQIDPADSGAPVEDEAYFVSQICSHWNKSFDSVLEVGRLLNKAAATMPKKTFRRKFAAQLPFTYSVAQRLRKLGRSERINAPENRPFLPFSWNTLAAIDNLSDEAFGRGVREKIITPQCQFKDIKRLRDEQDRDEKINDLRKSRATDSNSRGQEASPVAKGDKSLSRLRPTEKLKAIEKRMKAAANKPAPLHIWMPNTFVQDAHLDELATLVEELNRQLPQQYPFISEVRMGGPK